MVKKLIIITVLVFISYFAYTQEFMGGITGGLVGSQVAGDRYAGYHKAGLFLGGYVYYPFYNNQEISMELYYIQKGSRETPTEDNNYEKYVMNLHYAELALLYRYRFGERFAADAGLAYAVYITKKEEWTYQDEVSGKPFNRHNLSFVAGVYFCFTDQYRIFLRTNNSITPIRPHNSGATRLFNQGQYSDAICIGLQVDL